MSFKDYRTIFESIYSEFDRDRKITTTSQRRVAARLVTLEEFDQLTLNKELQRYISLIDGRIKMHTVPNAPHGEVIGYLTVSISHQLAIGTAASVMMVASDNGMSSF